MPRRLLSVLAAAGLLATSITPTLAESAAAPPARDARFGIVEAFRNPAMMAEIGPGWQRIILPWNQVQPNGAGDFSNLGQTIDQARLQASLDQGVRLAGVFQFTPDWAQAHPDQGARSAPRNLFLPADHPDNYFGRYVYETAQHYRGRINQWIVWNEPEFRPGDPGAGGSYTWLGTDEEFAQLLKVAYLQVKRANPDAVVSFPGTSYWIDQNSGRPQFYERILAILASDPDAAANNYYHDVVSLNLYRAADDVYRVHGVFKGIQQRFGLDKPVWLTETNAMPTDDGAIPCADRHANTAIKTTMGEQAAYAIQAFALAAAAGYQQVSFYQMVDGNPCQEPAVWGVTRDDGTKRPVADALRVAMRSFAGYTSARFVPLVRETRAWPTWPEDPTSYLPNWQVYQVAFDRPGNQRVSALWNGDGTNLRARVKQRGTSAHAVDRTGREWPLEANQGWWVVDLPAATAHYYVSPVNRDPDGYYFIGGDPVLVVEEGVAPDAPVTPPRLGDPGSTPREFKLFASPADQTVARGTLAEFGIASRGYEDFSDPIALRVTQWSSQRFPEPKGADSLPFPVSLPEVIHAGDTAVVRIDTAAASEGGIYYLTVEATGGGITRSIELALVVN